MGDRILPALVVIVGAILLFLLLLWLSQRRLIYFPTAERVPPSVSIIATSEEIAFKTEDGLLLKGWFVPVKGKGKHPAALIFNGNAGDRSHRAPLASALSRIGVSVLLFDYRGYGGNPGSPSESGLISDAGAARKYLSSRADVDSTAIVYFGESLGAAVAVALALEHPPAALIVRSPFTSLPDIGRFHYPYLPVRLLLTDTYDSIFRIGRIHSPILVIAGGKDGIIPASQSRKLYDLAPEPKRFVEIPGADHNDFDLLAGEEMLDQIRRFLTETVRLPLDSPSKAQKGKKRSL